MPGSAPDVLVFETISQCRYWTLRNDCWVSPLLPDNKLDFNKSVQTPSLCSITYRALSSRIQCLCLHSSIYTCTAHQTVDHSAHAHRSLAGIHYLPDPYDQPVKELVDFLAAPQLIGVHVQNNQSHICREQRDAGIDNIFNEPAEDRLKSDFVAVGECAAEGGSVTQRCEDGYRVFTSIHLLQEGLAPNDGKPSASYLLQDHIKRFRVLSHA